MTQSSQLSVTGSSSSSKTPASCISAITFDDSAIHLMNKSDTSSMSVHMSKHASTEENDDKQTESAEGSLFKRIMNGLNEMNTHDPNKGKVLNRERKGKLNEWRQVRDIHSDKLYFYNRRTRETSWTLPPDAVLVSKRKNKEMDKDTNTSIEPNDVPCEVSMTSEEKPNLSMHSNVSDCYSSLLQKDHEESQIILERCRKLRNSFKYTERRKYFFPDTSRETNYEYENDIDSSSEKLDSDHLKSGIDQSHNQAHFYCLYCGHKVSSAAIMSEHLTKHHYDYKNRTDEFTSEYMSLKNIMNKFWSENHHNDTHDVHVDDKENIRPCVDATKTSWNEDDERIKESFRKYGTDLKGTIDTASTSSIKMEHDTTPNKSFASYEIDQQSSDEESTIFTQSKSLTRKYQNISFENNKKPQRGESSNSEMKTSCPFCNKSFPSGSNLSSHLLNCKQRQNSNRKRTNNKQKSPSHSRFLQSGRKLPW